MDRETGFMTSKKEFERVITLVPKSKRELWWLVSAIGYGKLQLEYFDELPKYLLLAENTLTKVPPPLIQDLANALDWTGLLQDIKTDVQWDRPEDLENTLFRSEKLLAIAPVIGSDEKATKFLSSSSPHLKKIPPKWDHLKDTALRRSPPVPSHVLNLWNLVVSSL